MTPGTGGGRFLVVGDATLDVSVAPGRPPRAGGDVPASIRVGPGGQGANVAVRLARRGAAAWLVTALADDDAGHLLRIHLAREGVELLAAPAPRTSTVVALLDVDGERTMLSDRQGLDPGAVAGGLAGALQGAGWVHCSGYPLLDDEWGDALAAMLARRPPSQPLSVAGGSPVAESARVERLAARLRMARPRLLLLNRDEAAALAGASTAALAGAATRANPGAAARTSIASPADPGTAALAGQLLPFANLVVVTDGPRGSSAAMGAVALSVPAAALRTPAVDSTGSGDAYAAALIYELAGAPWPPDQAALRATMRNAARLGALVAAVVGAQGRVAGEREPG